MEKEFNIRFGVVNDKIRTDYEKRTKKPFSYELITPKKQKAIIYCQKKNNSNYIVERIFNTPKVSNKREEIYRSGSYEDYLKE